MVEEQVLECRLIIDKDIQTETIHYQWGFYLRWFYVYPYATIIPTKYTHVFEERSNKQVIAYAVMVSYVLELNHNCCDK